MNLLNLRSPPAALRLALLASIVVFWSLRIGALAWRMSPTYDEPKHLATGLNYLANGWCCFGKDNTPMVGLNALPLYAMGALPRLELEGDEVKQAVRASAAENPLRVRYFRARLMNLVLAFALTAGVAWLVGRAFGSGVGLLAALLITLEPNLSANAALVSPDFQVAVAMTLAALVAGELLDRGASLARIVSTGAAIALALLSKYNALALLPALLLVALVMPAPSWRVRLGRLAAIGAATAIAACLIALAYELPHALGGLRGLGLWPFAETPWSAALRTAVDPPLQEEISYGFLGGFAEVRRIMKMGYPSYFHGEIADTFALFYPALLVLKTPVVLLLLAPLGLVVGLRARPRRAGLLVLVAGAAILFLGAMSSGLALGVRHILPLYPLLAVLAALALVRARGRVAFKIALVAVLAIAGLRHHPHDLAYFNEIAGGPEQGHRYFADSNLDWGQDLWDLRAAMERLGVSYQAYLHSIFPPAHLGLLPDVHSKKIAGWIAVSVTRRLGLWANMYRNDGALRQALEGREPIGRVGYSVWLYYLPR